MPCLSKKSPVQKTKKNTSESLFVKWCYFFIFYIFNTTPIIPQIFNFFFFFFILGTNQSHILDGYYIVGINSPSISFLYFLCCFYLLCQIISLSRSSTSSRTSGISGVTKPLGQCIKQKDKHQELFHTSLGSYTYQG